MTELELNFEQFEIQFRQPCSSVEDTHPSKLINSSSTRAKGIINDRLVKTTKNAKF